MKSDECLCGFAAENSVAKSDFSLILNRAQSYGRDGDVIEAFRATNDYNASPVRSDSTLNLQLKEDTSKQPRNVR